MHYQRLVCACPACLFLLLAVACWDCPSRSVLHWYLCIATIARPLIDAQGVHLSVCKLLGTATDLHNKMNFEVLKMHRECGRYTSIEESKTVFADGGPIPDGVIKGGPVSWVVDTSVRSPLKDGVLAGSSSQARHAASLGESEKDRIYSDHCRDIGYQFLPAVFETFGAIGDRLAAHMQSLQCEYVESLGQGLVGRRATERWLLGGASG